MFKKIFNSAIRGLFWLLPMAAIVFIVIWLFEKISLLSNYIFNLFGFDPEKYQLIWTLFAVLILFMLLAIIGQIAKTRLAIWFEKMPMKVPLYSTLKDIIGIFNSAKNKPDILVVAIKGFTQTGYNIGLMYSIKEGVLKDHYTVTLSMSPIPNGGFMFEIHKDDIWVIKHASFKDNLNYLLSMGTKSLSEILQTEPQDRLVSLSDFLAKK